MYEADTICNLHFAKCNSTGKITANVDKITTSASNKMQIENSGSGILQCLKKLLAKFSTVSSLNRDKLLSAS